MAKRLDYEGRRDFSKPRRLSEEETLNVTQKEDATLTPGDEREEKVTELFDDLAAVYLKGRVVLDGLSKMEPAQFIPIEDTADSVSAAATRISPEQSQQGTVITYSMYQVAVDKILSKKWDMRLNYLDVNIPASSEAQTTFTVEECSDNSDSGGLLESFLSQNGIAGTILAMLTLSPFQTIIFQTLTTEWPTLL